MKFILTPILEKMEQLYLMPRNRSRFDAYLFMLQGNKKSRDASVSIEAAQKDMVLPIAGYNPMGNDFTLQQLRKLIRLEAENIATEEITKINSQLGKTKEPKFDVVINMADDIGGSWSNRTTTDFTSKFDIAPLIKRNFCTPYFWTGETFNPDMIRQKIREYLWRTVHWTQKGKPITLKDHVHQEIFVRRKSESYSTDQTNYDFTHIKKIYSEYRLSENYNVIFNFFYGDESSKQLNYPTYGAGVDEGHLFITHLSKLDNASKLN
ncbi:MAG: hypothetical protein AAGA77_21425 [Bacteroidota bacterium]